jgi:hypothetical protein
MCRLSSGGRARGRHELMVEPIGKRKNGLHVPFAFSNDKDSEGAKVQGQLALAGTDPLPVLIRSAVSDPAAYTAWAYMLLGFAELTCNSPEPVVRESRTEHLRFLPGTTSGAGTAAPEVRACGPSGRGAGPWNRRDTGTRPGAPTLLPTSADSRSAGSTALRPRSSRYRPGSASSNRRPGSAITYEASPETPRSASAGAHRQSLPPVTTTHSNFGHAVPGPPAGSNTCAGTITTARIPRQLQVLDVRQSLGLLTGLGWL